jgi:transcriptional regulator of met regulon
LKSKDILKITVLISLKVVNFFVSEKKK